MRYCILFLAIFLVLAACSDDPVSPPDPFAEYEGPIVSIHIEPFMLNEGDETELTMTVHLSCHRQTFSAFEQDVVIHFALRVWDENGSIPAAEEGVDYTIDLKPLALPAYQTRGWVKIPIKILADDQQEGDEYIELIIDRILDADEKDVEFWGPVIRIPFASIHISGQ